MIFRGLFLIAFIVSLLLTGGCALSATQLGAITTSKEVTDNRYSFSYTVDNNELVNVVKASISSLGWKKLEEHRNVLLDKGSNTLSWRIKTKNTMFSEYEKSWNAVAPDERVDDLTFIKLRTPIGLFSFGANIFVGVSSKGSNSTIKYSASTTQIIEKSNLDSYLNKISALVDEKAKNIQGHN